MSETDAQAVTGLHAVEAGTQGGRSGTRAPWLATFPAPLTFAGCLGGGLLLLPGFISDVLALICLLPVTRKALLGAVIGWDMSAALALGDALGVPPLAMAELLPVIEAVMVPKLNEQMDHSHG